MSDESALAVREETEDRSLEPGDRSEETGDRIQEAGHAAAETLTPALSQGEREGNSAQVAERIRQSEALPAGLRSRLAELVLAQDGAAAEQAIRAVEAALPFALRMSMGQIARPAHPGGEAFFHGDADAASEEAAEALARGQLARSGMLRGQRARVAE
jgi:hypothetical protein